MAVLTKKRAWLGLLFLLTIEVAWATGYLKEKTKQETPATRNETTKTTTPVFLSLDPAEAEVPVGREFQVTIVLGSSQKPVVGADVILKYEPEELTILAITPGQIFNFYPKLEKQKGKVLISAINQEEKIFSGQGVLAQLNLKGKTTGETKLRFEFKPGQTTDSNVVIKNSYQDSLEEVKSGRYTFYQ